MQSQQTTLKALFPGLAPEEEEEARHAFRRYLAFIMRLHGRIVADPGERERFAALTAERQAGSIDLGRTFTSQIPDTEI